MTIELVCCWREQDPQSRRWPLTINNPKDCGLNHDMIIEKLHLFHPRCFCLADEIGENGAYHTHIYLFSHSPIRFSTIKNRFPSAHIEKSMKGSVANRDYITKSGKWADTKKAETSVEGTFFEFVATFPRRLRRIPPPCPSHGPCGTGHDQCRDHPAKTAPMNTVIPMDREKCKVFTGKRWNRSARKKKPFNAIWQMVSTMQLGRSPCLSWLTDI